MPKRLTAAQRFERQAQLAREGLDAFCAAQVERVERRLAERYTLQSEDVLDMRGCYDKNTYEAVEGRLQMVLPRNAHCTRERLRAGLEGGVEIRGRVVGHVGPKREPPL